MTQSTTRWRSLACALSLAALGTGPTAQATVVEFQTVLGNFQVNLFDETTPLTVTNFLDYVNNGAYSDSLVHRVNTGFVMQGGGFSYDGTLPIDSIPTNPTVANEPELSNVRGTIAMAKLTNLPDSATNQWFINLRDNSLGLDVTNSGFTVFGIVLDDGMDVVDAIAALPQLNFSTDPNFGDVPNAFNELPLRAYTSGDPNGDNLVVISAVVVTDSMVSTNIDLLPPENTLIDPPPVIVLPPGTVIPTDNGGGGALGLVALFMLGALSLRRRRSVRI